MTSGLFDWIKYGLMLIEKSIGNRDFPSLRARLTLFVGPGLRECVCVCVSCPFSVRYYYER